jgi:hypothetical protein
MVIVWGIDVAVVGIEGRLNVRVFRSIERPLAGVQPD